MNVIPKPNRHTTIDSFLEEIESHHEAWCEMYRRKSNPAAVQDTGPSRYGRGARDRNQDDSHSRSWNRDRGDRFKGRSSDGWRDSKPQSDKPNFNKQFQRDDPSRDSARSKDTPKPNESGSKYPDKSSDCDRRDDRRDRCDREYKARNYHNDYSDRSALEGEPEPASDSASQTSAEENLFNDIVEYGTDSETEPVNNYYDISAFFAEALPPKVTSLAPP